MVVRIQNNFDRNDHWMAFYKNNENKFDPTKNMATRASDQLPLCTLCKKH